jgi:hypothetical protein
MSRREWRSRSVRLIALLCSSYSLRFAVPAQVVQHVRVLRPDPLAKLRKVLRLLRIAGCGCNGLGKRVLSRAQVAGGVLPLAQLLVGGRPVPERDCPLQAVRLHGACRQERDLAVENIDCLFRLMRYRQQRNPIFIVCHDAGHALSRGGAFGLIELSLAGGDGFAVLCLQQPGTVRARSRHLPQGGCKAEQQSSCAKKDATGQKRQTDLPRGLKTPGWSLFGPPR